jgi:hypothetical protein
MHAMLVITMKIGREKNVYERISACNQDTNKCMHALAEYVYTV